MEVAYQIPRASLQWILLSVFLVIAPQSIYMPIWITLIAFSCLLWRYLIFIGRLNYQSRLMRVIIVTFTLLISIAQMRSLGVGLESASSLLTLGFVFKLVEMREKRDIYVVMSLSFVVCMVAFLYSQSLLISLYVAACIVVIIATLIALNRSSLQADARSTGRMALRMALQALPLTIVLFMVFPRIAPLWAVPVQTTGGTTGVTDEMTPGDLASLGRSSELAFRVQFENGPPPLHQDLYWRGLVLENFDGTTWMRRRYRSAYGTAAERGNFQFNWENRVLVQGEPLQYNVILEPTQQPWVYGLHLADPLNRNLFQSRNFEIYNNGLISKRFSYDLRSYANNQTDLVLLDSARARNTEIPQRGNERSIEFARELRRSVNTDRDFVYAVLAHFRDNPFYYTLNPELLRDNRIDDFLFNTREGFCEHFASTFAFLMRAAGVPTRVVVGYHGAEYNPYEDYMMVYQNNAHAWNEVWLEGEGWVRFDPTGAVSPERIELGVEAALQDDLAFMEQSLFAAVSGRFSFFNTLRLRLDALEYEWNRRVVSYDEEVQVELFEHLFGEITEQKVLLLLVGLASLVMVAVGLSVVSIGPRRKLDPVTHLYQTLASELSRIGLARKTGEGPLDYRDRVVAARPELAELMHDFTSLYVAINYKPPVQDEQLARKQVKVLKQRLNNLRAALSPLRRSRAQS
jgi:transglutaminase-like putative cysteine protease